MAGKKETAKAKKTEAKKKPSMEQLREQHPFESDSQIQNRYGSGRERSGSDGTNQDARGTNH